MKKRSVKAIEYDKKYSDIPRDDQERLKWMYDTFKINDKISNEILLKRDSMMHSLYYSDILVKLYEEPEGSPRPRFRIVNRKNFANMAISNSQFVHVYSITGAEDNKYMRRIIDSDELLSLNNLIYTPCLVTMNAFFKTPSQFNRVDAFLAEIGLIRPITKPDWDNIGKKYSDMYNGNVWLDDNLVISGTVNKFYSILPRVEIGLRYLNMLYNKYQYKSIQPKVECEVDYYK